MVANHHYYQNLELAHVQFVLHEKKDRIAYANGLVIPDLHVRTSPALKESQALERALEHIDAEIYMWEIPKNEALLKRSTADPNATYYPSGQLMLSCGNEEPHVDKFHLVYRFDIFAAKPFSHN